MKKLQSMAEFKSLGLNDEKMSKILGGNAPVATGSGSKGIYNDCNELLFTTYWTSDCNNGPGANGVDIIDYYGTSASY